MSNSFECVECGASFTVPPKALKAYPGWVPKKCLACRDKGKPNSRSPRASRPAAGGVREVLTLDEVLAAYHDGPTSGVFTDGSAQPNPGPGGWGVVYVVDNAVVDQRHGQEKHTTNNRMELVALIEGYKMLPEDATTEIWTDSQLCCNTVTKWAAAWEARGWRRKGGEIKNLELVQELYALALAHPTVTMKWVQAHAGLRWNEYADALSTAYARDVL